MQLIAEEASRDELPKRQRMNSASMPEECATQAGENTIETAVHAALDGPVFYSLSANIWRSNLACPRLVANKVSTTSLRQLGAIVSAANRKSVHAATRRRAF